MKTLLRVYTLMATLLVASQLQAYDARTPFNGDSAYVRLKAIAGDIGARPIGSPAERAALEYAVEQFRRFGIAEAYVMDLYRANIGKMFMVNTSSGVAVGILRGASPKTIVLGAHIDSSGPDIPGANDDGSGTAVILELARVLAQRRNEYTIVFALFGGEEQGLIGSQHFVKEYPHIEDVVLMVQADMANGTEWIVPLLNSPKGMTPRWLVSAAYDEAAKLGITGLDYPTHFMVVNSGIMREGISSDHLPFLQRGIPAMDFTTDMRDPIHTAQDNLENFHTWGLQRSGDLLYALVERFDGNVPEHSAEPDDYYLIDPFGSPIFVPLWVLYALVLLSAAAGVMALFRLRDRRPKDEQGVIVEEGNQRPKVPALKSFVLMLVIQTFVWFADNIVGLFKGVNIPWYAEPQGYIVLGGLAGIAGLWVALQWASKMNLSRDPYRWFLRAFVWLFLLTALLFFLSIKLAVAPAVGLLLMAIAAVVPATPWIRLLLWLAAPYMMYRIPFNEGFEFFLRMIASMPGGSTTTIIANLLYVLFFSLWAFPFMLGFAALYHAVEPKFVFLKYFRQPVGIVVTVFALLVCGLWLLTRPAYNEVWQRKVAIRQNFDDVRGTAFLSIESPERLAGIALNVAGNDTLYEGWTVSDVIAIDSTAANGWSNVEHSVQQTVDSVRHVRLFTGLTFKARPYRVRLSYSARSPLKDPSSPLAFTSAEKKLTFTFYSFPDSVLAIPVSFSVSADDSVITEYVDVEFTRTAVPVRASAELTSFEYRTIISAKNEIRLQ